MECKNLWHWTQSYNTRGGSEGGFGGGVLEEEETRRGGEGARGARGEEGGRGEVEEGRRERTWWEREAGGRGAGERKWEVRGGGGGWHEGEGLRREALAYAVIKREFWKRVG